MSKVFVDTNILIYTLDRADLIKQKKAREGLLELETQNLVVVSTQILQEFFVVSTKKLGLDPLFAKNIISSYENFEVVTVTPDLIREAIDGHILNQISFWDALIVVSAKSAGCEILWSEDLNPGQVIQGVRIENPFHKTAKKAS